MQLKECKNLRVTEKCSDNLKIEHSKYEYEK